MRRSLSGVRARVERLASRLGSSTLGGCAICRKDEEQVRLRWDNPQTGPLTELPQSKTCDECGRTYALRYHTLGTLLGPRMPPAVRLGAARTVTELGIHRDDADNILRKLDQIEAYQREQETAKRR